MHDDPQQGKYGTLSATIFFFLWADKQKQKPGSRFRIITSSTEIFPNPTK